jgi:hypothetical protein
MPRDRDYVNSLADTAYELLIGELQDPSAEEIAYAYFSGQLIGGEVTEGIRKRLKKIRDRLHETYKLEDVYLVSETYYSRFKRKVPTDLEDARLCLPLGYGKGAAGLRRHTGDNDLIWDAMHMQNSNSAGSKFRFGIDRVVNAVEREEISQEHGADLVYEGDRKLEPKKPHVAAALRAKASTLQGPSLAELPPPEEEIPHDEPGE